MLELGGNAYIVLPYGPEQFKQDSVCFTPDSPWGPRFDRMVERATWVLRASEQRMLRHSGLAFEFANLLLHGLSNIRADRLETELVPIAVWDGKPGPPGGTASVVQRWRSLGYEIEWIKPAESQPIEITESPVWTSAAAPAESSAPPEFEMRMMALLFADALHFSKLTEEQIPGFVQHFLGGISRLPAMVDYPPELKDTWGDGLYFVFGSVRHAGLFALELADFMLPAGKWAALGLPENLNLRIALHAGPVYACQDPITEQRNFTGTHVSRAARLEPVTPPGLVYASQEFAALVAAERIQEFRCEYVGQTPLAKAYGTIPTYHVRRATRNSPTPGPGAG